MPLMKKKSKTAFSHNVKAEMEAGKPQKQSLAIAYSVKRKAKKMADGGSVSASDEKRPMPESRANDSQSISRNSGNKPAHQDGWTDKPTEAQAKANDVRGRKLPIKRPKMVPTDAFSTRMYDAEGQLEESASPGPYDAQPPRHDDEEGPDRQGPKVPDMASEHSNGRKPYAEGGMAEMEEEHHASITAAIMSRRNRLHAEIDSGAHDLDSAVRMAEGGMLESEHMEEPNNEDQMSFEALKKENYNSSDLDVDIPRDSAQIGDDREEESENKHDMIGSIRSRMKRRQSK